MGDECECGFEVSVRVRGDDESVSVGGGESVRLGV